MLGRWIDPITRRRWQRFCRTRRAFYSLWALVLLYVVGLCANFLANDKPLVVRYEGDWYFPVFFFYPGTDFGGELSTRVDYKDLAQEARFADESGNWMVFAPLPFGPHENIPPADIDAGQTIQVSFFREPHVASVDLNDELEIRRAQSPEFFFGGSDLREIRGTAFGDYWRVGDDFKQAVARRFDNQPAGAITVLATNPSDEQVELSLSPFEPRSRAPKIVRVLLREAGVEGRNQEVSFNAAGEAVSELPTLWQDLSENDRQMVLAGVQDRFTGLVPDERVSLGGATYRVRFSREDVAYPFRPTHEHPLGLDNAGRDVLARILYALRISLNFGFLLVIATMVVGTIIGGVQGYSAGWLDLIGQRLIEIWESLPFLYVIILLGSVFGQSFGLLLLVYALFNWIGISYYMRGEFLKLRKQPFIEAARVMGIPPVKIMWRHMLPNSLVPLITFFPFSLVGAISVLTALDYLGFGLPPPTPSWGELLSQAQEHPYAWWLILYPAVALFIVLLLTVFIGEGIRSAFDPRVANRIE
ncbi:MAG: microcin C transport system permease protein [Puniceicoccaceae bacterium 5H]|nr:MAG: microcin C transport system permease protein [Puniceicoccaceae bacterium 5H]